MASIAQAVVANLQTLSAVTALVATRIYPARLALPDKVYPLVVYDVSDVAAVQTYGGANALTSATLKLTVVSDTYAVADAVGEALRASLDNTGGTWGGTAVQGCFLADDGMSDEVVTEPESDSVVYYIKELSFQLWYVNA